MRRKKEKVKQLDWRSHYGWGKRKYLRERMKDIFAEEREREVNLKVGMDC